MLNDILPSYRDNILPEDERVELCYWRRLLRVPWTSRRSNQSILKEINSEYLLEGLMLKLKFQFLGHLMLRADSLKNTLILAGGGGSKVEMVG